MSEQENQIEVIFHEWNEILIPLRVRDGYINGTAICKATGKRMGHYLESSQTIEFLHGLSDETGIPADQLVQSRRGGVSELQGTWIHRRVGINLSMWADPGGFGVVATKWIEEWLEARLRADVGIPTLENQRCRNTDIGSLPTAEAANTNFGSAHESVVDKQEKDEDTELQLFSRYTECVQLCRKRLPAAEKEELLLLRLNLLRKLNKQLG